MIPLGFLAGNPANTFTTWTRASIPASMVMNGATYAPLSGGSYFIFGSSSTGSTTSTYYYSADGSSWSTGTLPSASETGSALYNGTTLVVNRTIGAGASTSSTPFYTSTDGTTWTTRSFASARKYRPGIFNGSHFIYPSTNEIVYSADGATWSNALTFDAYAVASDNAGLTIAINGNGESRICTGSVATPSNWATGTTLPTITGTYSGIVYGNGLWLAYTSRVSSPSNVYAYSTNNGTSWSTGTLPAVILSPTASTFDHPGDVIAHNGAAFYYSIGNNVYYSGNGLTWTTVSTGSGLAYFTSGHAMAENKMIMVGKPDSNSTGTTTILVGTL